MSLGSTPGYYAKLTPICNDHFMHFMKLWACFHQWILDSHFDLKLLAADTIL